MKSPASAIRPRELRSRFGDGTGLKVTACDVDARRIGRRPRRRRLSHRSPVDGLSHEEGFIAEPKCELVIDVTIAIDAVLEKLSVERNIHLHLCL